MVPIAAFIALVASPRPRAGGAVATASTYPHCSTRLPTWISRGTTAACETGTPSTVTMAWKPPSECSQSSSLNSSSNASFKSLRRRSRSARETSPLGTTRTSAIMADVATLRCDYALVTPPTVPPEATDVARGVRPKLSASGDSRAHAGDRLRNREWRQVSRGTCRRPNRVIDHARVQILRVHEPCPSRPTRPPHRLSDRTWRSRSMVDQQPRVLR